MLLGGADRQVAQRSIWRELETFRERMTMPVPALPPDNTQRYYYDYSVYAEQHTLIVRCGPSVGLSEAKTQIDLFLQAIGGGLVTITTVGLRHSEAGSNITNPVDADGIAATYGSGVGSAINAPLQVTFTGRSGDGHKARVGMFGWESQTDSSWRYTTAENADVLAAIVALQNAQGEAVFVSISGGQVLWHPYMNVGYNDHWVKHERS